MSSRAKQCHDSAPRCRLRFLAHLMPVLLLASGGRAETGADRPKMGVISDLSRVEGPAVLCDHKVPEQVCTRHHPELIAKFKAVNDWCGGHDVPESQCFACHPDLTFEKLPTLPESADITVIAKAGEDVPDLDALVVRGKVTVFDFYADWCAACREIDLHMYKLLLTRQDIAVRKLNVVDWDTPLAKRYLAKVKGLPYLIVYGKSGKKVKAIEGLHLEKIDAALAEGAR